MVTGNQLFETPYEARNTGICNREVEILVTVLFNSMPSSPYQARDRVK